MGATLLINCATMAAAGPVEDFAAIEQEYQTWLLRESPEYASAIGIDDFRDQVSDPSIAAMDRRASEAAAMLARVDAIAAADLPAVQQVNRAIMRRQLDETVEGNRYGQRLMLFTTYSGWHQRFAGLADDLPFRSGADFRSYLTRLAQYPAYNDTAIAVTRQAIASGYVLPCVVLGGHARSIEGVIADDPTASRFYAPFNRARPADLDAAQWAAMQAEARTMIRDVLNPAYRAHLSFFNQEYLPRCTQNVGISAQPGGREYYDFRIRQETTTTMSADEIHTLGLSEVARIRAEMSAVAARAGFASREAMIADMRTNPRHFATTPEELMRATARITRRIDGHMPRLFGLLPRLPYTIREIPAEIAEGTTTAYYSPGSPTNGVAGTYYVNTSLLNQRPLWEIPALSVHEAVPGHHHQIALQQELNIPLWRRYFVGFTAYTEGWGLYSERLGIEMGLYDTPEADMGRLSYEMWRACRLVVDTGLHSRGWTREQAVAFMRDNSALTEANISAEVNRYISWPGQALGYKIGELRIRALRERAERELGPRFDLRHFHDVVLGQGAVPLDVLEAQVGAWITAQQSAPAPGTPAQ
ncbi:MAG: DUF885 domain-containing protein [Sphingopyxis sp.]|nr:DUF885 domain-containing protein [Sphingopyxis sp.]